MSETFNPEILEPTYTFGNEPAYEVTRFSLEGSGCHLHDRSTKETITLARPSIKVDHYLQALEDINQSWRVIEDKKTGKQFEIALANLAMSADQGVDAELSTYTSSISGNLGNGIEFAEHSALHPDRQRLYIASFGNGKSSYWETEEQAYIKKTGRFT
jgi:hypothetical protein